MFLIRPMKGESAIADGIPRRLEHEMSKREYPPFSAISKIAETRLVLRARRYLQFVPGLISTNHQMYEIQMLVIAESDTKKQSLAHLVYTSDLSITDEKLRTLYAFDCCGVAMKVYQSQEIAPALDALAKEWVNRLTSHLKASHWVGLDESYFFELGQDYWDWKAYPCTDYLLIQELCQIKMWIKTQLAIHESCELETLLTRLEGFIAARNNDWSAVLEAAKEMTRLLSGLTSSTSHR